MSPTTVTLIVIVVIIIVAIVAWFVYKAGFKAKEITVKTGLMEAKLERSSPAAEKPEVPTIRTEAAQEALQGGKIKDSNIKAPADSGAKLRQRAENEGSSITGSDIELK